MVVYLVELKSMLVPAGSEAPIGTSVSVAEVVKTFGDSRCRPKLLTSSATLKIKV